MGRGKRNRRRNNISERTTNESQTQNIQLDSHKSHPDEKQNVEQFMDDSESEAPVTTTNYESFNCTATRPKTPTNNDTNTKPTPEMTTTSLTENYDELQSAHSD